MCCFSKIALILYLASALPVLAADSLKVSVHTANPSGGGFGSRYAVVMWIENAAGAFIKSFGRWGNDTGTNDLPIWNSKNGGVKTIDGVTGATQSTATTLASNWNCTNASGAAVPAGTYWVNIELSNHHSNMPSPTDLLIRSSIVIDGTSKTSTTIDSSFNSASTYLTAFSASYISAVSKTLSSIAVTPAAPSISAGATQQFTATGTYSDNSTANITSSVTWTSGTPGTATISTAGLATAVAAGTSTITATLSGKSGIAALTVTAVTKTLSSIAVTPAAPVITAGQTQQFAATGTYSDNSTANITSSVTWLSGSTGVATITAAGLATGVAAGTSTVTASLSGKSGTAQLAVKTLSSIAVSPSNPSVGTAQTVQFTATGTYSDNSTANISSSVTWQSGSTNIATISSAGLATGVALGTSAIIATLSGKTGTAQITVSAAQRVLVSLTVSPATASILVGKTQQFTASGRYSDSTNSDITATATWQSSNTTFATIAAGGLATGRAQGVATITATLSGKSGTAQLTVNPVVLSSITVTPATASILTTQTQQFNATGRYNDSTTANITSTATWQSSSVAIATVAAGGLTTGHAKGVVTISAVLSGKTGTAQLTLTKPVILQSILVQPNSPTVKQGDSLQLSMVCLYSDSSTQPLTTGALCQSSNCQIAEVNASGLLKGLAAGSADIIVTYQGVFGMTSVNVTGLINVEKNGDAMPARVFSAYPNPFKHAINIHLAVNDRPSVFVVNAGGQKIRSLVFNDGSGNSVWDGKDEKGLNAPTGFYYLVVKKEAASSFALSERALFDRTPNKDIIWQKKVLLIR